MGIQVVWFDDSEYWQGTLVNDDGLVLTNIHIVEE